MKRHAVITCQHSTSRGLTARSSDAARCKQLRYIVSAILWCWYGLAMATISVQVNPPTVQLGDMFRLVLTIDNPQSGGIPNLIPLQENFTIAGTERSMLYSIINGQTHAVNQWTVLLTAKQVGILPIPPIQIGPQQSMATSVEVIGDKVSTALDNLGGPPQAEVMLKTKVSVKEPFVNQQVIYTVKLYNSQRLLEAEYKPPTVEDALLVPLGEGLRSQETVNGRSYAVEEQQYAIFPQKSGDLNIAPPSFNALVFDAVPRRLKVKAKPIQLVVKSKPADYSGKDWLPASQVALTEIYEQKNTKMNQGDTLVRTITLQAAGVPAQLLPIFDVANGPEFNAYTEKPVLKNTSNQQELVGRVDVKVTYLLNKAGHVTIPALSVPWFNTVTGKEERVSLPARTLDIEATQGGMPQQVTTTSDTVSPVIAEPRPLGSGNPPAFVWWLAGGLILVGIAAIVWWWRRCSLVRKGSTRLILKKLHKACVNNNQIQTQLVLLQWAALRWPNACPLNLQHLAKLTHDSSLKKQLTLLSEALYGQEQAIKWQGDALWRSVQAFLHTKPTLKSKPSELPPINPD